MINFDVEGVEMPQLDFARVCKWLIEVAAGYNKRIGNLCYKFCNDDEILRVNRKFLSHDYYTDIITFDYTIGDRIGADIYISLDTVLSNAKELKLNFDSELKRVIVHGLLHLCGLKDKSPEQRKEMESAENDALIEYDRLK